VAGCSCLPLPFPFLSVPAVYGHCFPFFFFPVALKNPSKNGDSLTPPLPLFPKKRTSPFSLEADLIEINHLPFSFPILLRKGRNLICLSPSSYFGGKLKCNFLIKEGPHSPHFSFLSCLLMGKKSILFFFCVPLYIPILKKRNFDTSGSSIPPPFSLLG